MKLEQQSIAGLRGLLDRREISAAELTWEYLRNIRRKDQALNSYITVLERDALILAEQADRRLSCGDGRALTGIPLSVKDNICTKGVRTTCGSNMLRDFVPGYDAYAAERLREQDAVLLGKNNMDEFAMGSSSTTSCFGAVHNPYDIRRIAGGSSGGGAAAVAAGLAVGALGSDTGGSVRQPAALCGITGIKPTYGTVSRYGLIAFASSLDQIGVLARCARDCAVILQAVSGRDPRDSSMAGRDIPAVDSDARAERFTIGVPKELFGDEIDDEIKTLVSNAIRKYESMGCQIQSVSLPAMRYAVAAYYLTASAEAASNLARYDGVRYGHRAKNAAGFEELVELTRAEGFGDEVKRRILLGNYALSSGYRDRYYKKAAFVRAALSSQLEEAFGTCDCLISPATPAPARYIDEEESPAQAYSADLCTVAANLAGLPAVSTTCGYDQNGMPVGMMLTGPKFSDSFLLAAADRFEREFERRECF
ncbi:Asp-tRNA(Asn)/Glu-tRNA(Gln) amidotransferase subunit GatA [Candidatus Soleaferrea massiliensis]|uniref:Asp-tRNA(Asn)/Glu-tRNA(Gln) amidotransferase subunit GatA n=1 Tax=Candidatus Soleaferrea massiliensis TaxID=1470354 RepID=UPI00058B3693|nr:Asp-tRNA(Asn)/Glu-tRNA(Gln) amidotransferase subunit GatA [Candidatus Soleaferrea massiliensis]